MAVLSAAYKGGNPLTLFKGDTPIKGGGLGQWIMAIIWRDAALWNDNQTWGD